MYTAKIKNKEIISGQMNVTVDFSNGTTTVTETCIPQDMEGFKFWVKSRLATFNGAEEIETTYNLNDPVDTTEPAPPLPSPEEAAKQEWFTQYLRLEQLEKLEAKGFLTGPRLNALNNKISQVKSFLDANIKTEYLDLL